MQNKNSAQYILDRTKDISMTSGNLSPSIEDFLQFSKSPFTCFRDFSMERKFPWIDSSETKRVIFSNLCPAEPKCQQQKILLSFLILPEYKWLKSYFAINRTGRYLFYICMFEPLYCLLPSKQFNILSLNVNGPRKYKI